MSGPDFSFFEVQTREEALGHLGRFARLGAEAVPLGEAAGRVLAADVASPEDLPPFRRSTVDGFAVRSRDTFAAGESSPALLEVVGEVAMGRPAGVEVRAGQTARIPTGGMLPEGADAVVMLEYSRAVDAATVELTRPAAPGSNVTQVGEDVARGQAVLPAGRRLRAQDVGLLAALGLSRVGVVRRPRVAILSTGNEVVAADRTPAPGQVRDVNAHTLAALSQEAGATPLPLGLVADDPGLLREAVERGLAAADVVLVSGGSSVGAADWTLRTFMSFPGAELLVHGVAIRPGKPLILVRVGERALLGLPGHTVSAQVTFQLFARPLLVERLLGAAEEPGRRVRALLGRSVAATPGRETWVRVRLEEHPAGLVAEPVLGSSGVISTLVNAHGLVGVPLGCEGLVAGTAVEVHLF